MVNKNPSSKIQLLPESLIDQIKAGEVIERPSTLLKELLENSVDAKASSIDVEIVGNGLDLLAVKDNGKGIPFEQLDLAFCRHATSKIERFEDLYNLFTYGFRGEALASISAVSKMTCVSNPAGEPEGTIKIHGGETLALDLDQIPEENSGTKMFVRDLFYNTPARMKFIQSKTSEKNQLNKIIKAFLLTQPQIKFSLSWEEQDRKVYPARSRENLKERVKETLAGSRQLTLIENEASYDGASLRIFVSRESSRGNAGKSHFIFVNERLVQDNQIHRIILHQAQSLWPPGETGHYCAYLTLPPERVDVNIHPNKTQVKFHEAGKVYSLVSGVVKSLLERQRSQSAPAPASSSRQEPLLKDDPANAASEGGIDYRQFEFDASNRSLQDYFDRLDSNSDIRREPQDEPESALLASFKDSALCRVENKYFAVKTAPLMEAWLEEVLRKGDKSPTPLLVSQPLTPKRPIGQELLARLAILGFEVDQISPQDYALRSFPHCLKNIPYKDCLQNYLDSPGAGENLAQDFARASQLSLFAESRHLLKALGDLGTTYLLEAGIVSLIDNESLKKIL